MLQEWFEKFMRTFYFLEFKTHLHGNIPFREVVMEFHGLFLGSKFKKSSTGRDKPLYLVSICFRNEEQVSCFGLTTVKDK